MAWSGFVGSSGYPTLRIEKNDLRSVTLLEAKAKVKDIAISRERITLKDVLQEGIYFLWIFRFVAKKISFCFSLDFIQCPVAALMNILILKCDKTQTSICYL